MNWQDNLIEDEAGVQRVVRGAKRVAVLGIKTEEQSGQPAFYVPEYLERRAWTWCRCPSTTRT